MASRIEEYALIGNRMTGALVDRQGSIDWLAVPRFDSAACFASLLGTPENGFWKIAPQQPPTAIHRRYREGTLVLETEFTTNKGKALLVDCMSLDRDASQVLRIVQGLEGTVPCSSELCARFEYGDAKPWIARLEDGRHQFGAGGDQLVLSSTVPVSEIDGNLRAQFDVKAGDAVEFSVTWAESFKPAPASPLVAKDVEHVSELWREWSRRYIPMGPWGEAVLRSLITLQALTNPQSGGIVAAPSTSLPEEIGGKRNWDYRYCWLRDATFTLYALMQSGFENEAKSWREWLLRAIGGAPDQMQIMYGASGERWLMEREVPWLNGYEGSKPVHVGNAASGQLQLDVYGEVLDLLYQAHRTRLKSSAPVWDVEKALVNHLATIWDRPDDGIWEVRGGRRQFTHSKVMAWVAFDRAVRSVEDFGHDGPVEHWRQLRDEARDAICHEGFNAKMGSFVQYFGGNTLDASLLLMPQVGFLPANDPAVKGTVAAVEKHLMRDGFVQRYDPGTSVDGLEGREGCFLACSFWLADVYTMQGRCDEARELFERVLRLRNDVGLLSEEYDTRDRRLVGNFPQAFSHVALINTARNLSAEHKPAAHRSQR